MIARITPRHCSWNRHAPGWLQPFVSMRKLPRPERPFAVPSSLFSNFEFRISNLPFPVLACLLLCCAALPTRAGQVVHQIGTPAPSVGGEYKSLLLYTPPDPSATGGLRLISPVPVEFAFAIPQSNQEHVYKATLGPDQKQIAFMNLPVSRYDLLLVTKDHFYEGISLNRDENSLTPNDLASIEEIFSRSVPFMNVKRTEVVKGTPGDDGRGAALVQWMRIGGNLLNQNDDLMVGHSIRSLRLAFLADVGPGWQVTGTRELLRTDVFPNMVKGFLGVTYVDDLNGIRVVDSVKDIGPVNLATGTRISDPVAKPSATPLP